MTDQEEEYRPSSPFLQRLIDDEPELSGSPEADALAVELIALTRDEDETNRDWALMILGQSELETPEALAALVAGMDDPEHEAGLEALIGVAMRAPELALPRVRALLDEDTVDSMTLEAAAYVADPSLLPLLEAIGREVVDDDDLFTTVLAEAIESCSRGSPPEAL
ncbi:MAG: lyase [Sphingomonadales bacterium]|nr:MAG: lyase [Sphingomonadales bacterium]